MIRMYGWRELCTCVIGVAFLKMLFLNTSIDEIYGGISSTSNSQTNVILIMRWGLCVLPPLVCCVLFMKEELQSVAVFTVVREKTIQQWWCKRWNHIGWINVLYLVVFEGVYVLENLLGVNHVHFNILRILPFGAHVYSMSVMSVIILTKFRSFKWVSFFFGMIEIFFVVIGVSSRALSSFIYPFWGMMNNAHYILDNKSLHYVISIGLQLGIVGFGIIYSVFFIGAERVFSFEKTE